MKIYKPKTDPSNNVTLNEFRLRASKSPVSQRSQLLQGSGRDLSVKNFSISTHRSTNPAARLVTELTARQ